MNMYQQRALEGASGVELVIALYDGIIRFLRDAIASIDREDVAGRRRAVKRAMDIVIHLQAILRMDVGGKPAEALSEFYTSIFALMLQGSQLSSKDRFEHAIAYVWNVREAWKQVASETHPDEDLRQDMRAIEEKALLPVLQGTRRSAFEGDQLDSCRWMA
jgi:flagellar protein FliS